MSVNGQPVPFPAPLEESCFKTLSGQLHSSCGDVSQQGPQSPLMRELVTGDPMACSVLGHPCKCPSGFIVRHQTWQLSPGLKHGRVESIDQLAQYHTQFNTPTEWHRQFCSGETRSDQFGFILSSSPSGSVSQKSSHAQWSTCLFLFASFSTSCAGILSTTRLTTI